MTFSYGYDLAAGGVDRVRWESSDTGEYDEGVLLGYFNENEEIEALLTIHNDEDTPWQKATLAAIRGIIGKLSRPSFQADWLRVDPKVAIDSYRKLLDEKSDEYGVELGEANSAWFESTSVDTARSDVEDWIDPDEYLES